MKNNKLPENICDLTFKKTIERWDEAIPLGNGQCGVLIWGKAGHLRFSLDRGDIWDTTPYPGIFQKEFTYQNMINLVKQGDEEEIRRIFDAPYNHALPSKLPAGKIILDLSCEDNVCSTLHLARAEAEIQVQEIRIRSFLHAQRPVGYIEINCPRNAFAFELQNPEYGKKGEQQEELRGDSVNPGSLKLLKYDLPERICYENTQGFIQKVNDTFSYGVFLKEKEQNGKTLMVYRIASSADGAEWMDQALRELDQALEEGYDEALAVHAKWWKTYWEKSSITLPDKKFEKNWYLAHYFLASCSRKGSYPMPLQGVWTADDGKLPPWKGDYHHDLNTQMSYYSYLKANHLEEGETFLDYLWDMAACARKFAESFYHSKGLCLPAVMALDGTPLGGWGMYSLSPTNQIWLCQAFERYYRFTGDREFLREKAYPYLRETAEFLLGILEEKDGKYYLPISSSPEIHDDRIESFLTPNTNYDLSLMRYLFTSLVRLSKELGKEETERWRKILNRLPDLAVNDESVLMLSPDECLEESHRHFSHAMAIHPLRLLKYDTDENRKIIDATVLDLERLGTGYWVGFSFAWMAELYAVQKNGNGAAYQLEVFWNNFCSQNGFHLNGDYKRRGTSTFHYRPFTLEANFCAADALQEMLLQSEDGVLELFPAIPDEWEEETIAFTDLRAEKGMLVSAERQQGKIISLILKPEYDGQIAIGNYEDIKDLLRTGKEDVEERNGFGILKLKAGKEYRFQR